ncbi:hypothetical protein THAOC_11447 [Thalassiosira oceanica]|uniref:Uncharacterized protein n=1 Tax=Thalassiosira oceanica TaxID=159749 RepID=K0T2J0_THAOC|nr:hypothetical protein THAOC_11447 [Thalassiosira oceanica]|eukprot:EJK67506.1 hypothetical protein THAOC_11447 [Thalassiosira oceanica]
MFPEITREVDREYVTADNTTYDDDGDDVASRGSQAEVCPECPEMRTQQGLCVGAQRQSGWSGPASRTFEPAVLTSVRRPAIGTDRTADEGLHGVEVRDLTTALFQERAGGRRNDVLVFGSDTGERAGIASSYQRGAEIDPVYADTTLPLGIC